MTEKVKVIKVGSRKSELALIQTHSVIEKLKDVYPETEFEIVTMSTLGDRILDSPLPKIGEKSLFTKDLEIALEENNVDMVVHSLKDMPTCLPSGLAIGAILEREDPRDAVILRTKHRGLTLRALPDNSVIGTSSLRRTAQLKKNYPHLIINDIRGNLQTRLKKLDQGHYDGIILAIAGIHRMNWDDRISEVLDEEVMLYAVGQGALAVECRVSDCVKFGSLMSYESALRCAAERSLLCTLEAGCSAPIAVTSSFCKKDQLLSLNAGVWSLDGSNHMNRSISLNFKDIPMGDTKKPKEQLYCGLSNVCLDKFHLEAAHKLGETLANELVKLGAKEIIKEAKASIENS